MQDATSSSENDQIQACTAGHRWNKLYTDGTKKNIYRRAVTLLRIWGRGCSPQRRNMMHAIKCGTEGIDRMGSAWITNHHSILQNTEKENQDESHPVLRTNEWQWWRNQRPVLQQAIRHSRQVQRKGCDHPHRIFQCQDWNGQQRIWSDGSPWYRRDERREIYGHTCTEQYYHWEFTPKRIQKTTWVSPDHLTEDQIDHICTGKRFRKSLENVIVKRGADVASDHYLLIARFKSKLKKTWIVTATNRWK